MLVDSHAHIQLDNYDKDRESVLTRARQADVHAILIVGFDLQTSQDAILLAESHDECFATVGMHPHDATTLTSATLDIFRKLASDPLVIALGEMGLDYYRNQSPRSLQKFAFEQQLDLAEELSLPVIIHNREAYHDILPILKARSGRIRGVMHCFSGDVKTMRHTLDLGFCIGIGGPVTYRKAEELQTVAREVPVDHLLVETDCPWLAPQNQRGKRNEPAYVRSTAEKIAELRGVSLDKIAEITTRNFERLFRDRAPSVS
ncbi:MAG: TatD family hydrolase [Candidatus Poribacteria bacterium]|nr:TatD family hydrolase [Candidatus Poribacteria bacterium]MDE0504575.1 TatD family hydrolase [Candidatus Poribacteria bacterium]